MATATTTFDETEKKQIKHEFDELVNMSASQMEKWLQTDESKAVGQKDNDSSESTGHKSGGNIIRILNKKSADLSNSDYEHMRKVVGYIKRHSAQRPNEIEGSNWEYSLKNWGHNPARK
ncbi:DUF3140 domain-containing protein [Spirosoma sp. SC4-14]|uniref:DUF3140 domain-containing protein n=1 Tax=Spirosoma sp. SC4-14 TaxID=3128900 RepID=UPI0030D3BFFC